MAASARTVTGIKLTLATASLPAPRDQATHAEPFRVARDGLQAILDADRGYSPAQSEDISELSKALAGQVDRAFGAFEALAAAGTDQSGQRFAFTGVQAALQGRMSESPSNVEAIGQTPYAYGGIVFSAATFELLEKISDAWKWTAFTQSAILFGWDDPASAEAAQLLLGRLSGELKIRLEGYQETLPIPAVATV